MIGLAARLAIGSGVGSTVTGMQQTRAAPPATLEAVLERITYANEETGYTVGRVATGRSSDLLTVVGSLLGAQPGESLRLRGRWASHPQYGRQFQVEAYDTVLPATIQGIRRYLGSGLIKAIGPQDGRADRGPLRRDHLGGDRAGAGTAGRGARSWPQAHRDDHRRLSRAAGHQGGDGLPPGRRGCRRRWRCGSTRPTGMSDPGGPGEPYRLASEVWGIGFRTADQLARSLGIPHDSPELVTKATVLLGVDVVLASRCLEELVAEEGVVAEPLPADVSTDAAAGTDRAVWLVPFHRADAAFDRDHPLDADLVAVDEVSMLDVLLADKLVKAMAPGAHLLLVSKRRPAPQRRRRRGSPRPAGRRHPARVRLTKVFRRAQQSGVVTNAHRINAGQSPITRGLDDFLLPRTTPTRSPTWSWISWPTACRAASASTRPATCRCCARCIGGRPGRAC
jgi:Helix-hairpin-helix containing domain